MNEGENSPDQKVLCALRATRCSSCKANLITLLSFLSIILLLNGNKNFLFKAQTVLNQLIYLWMFTLYR